MKYFFIVCLLLLLHCSCAFGQVAVAAPAKIGDTLSPHAAVTISHIIIEGNTVTRRAVILREIDLAEGDNILTDSIPQLSNEIRLRLFNLQLFNEIDQHVAIDTAGGIDWYITLKERWFIIPTLTIQYADRNFNTWLVKENHDLHRITGGVTLTDKNFRGNLEQLAVTVQAGYSQGLGLSYLRPYIDKKQTSGIGFWVHYIQGSQTYYTTDSDKLLYAGTYSGPVIWHQFDGGINYMYRPAYASKHLFRLGYKSFHVEDTIVKLNSDYFAGKSNNARFLELSYRYEYNGVDNWNYSLVGEKLIASAALRQGCEGINTQALAKIEAGIFRNPVPTWYWSAILRLRAMAPGDQPYYFKTALGTQTDYVRGYEYYTIDGTNYGIVRLDLKKEIFNNTYSFPVKYLTAIPLRIYPKIFADAGYVQNPEPGNSFLNNRLLYSAGFGVDIVTLYDIKIRIEVAWNHLGQNGLYLHFNSE